ncbi:MAG TPA: type II secretion system F family protein [Blastococcus sp.]|nr:type II secretion system F family protein [Blastococcus sp.]
MTAAALALGAALLLWVPRADGRRVSLLRPPRRRETPGPPSRRRRLALAGAGGLAVAFLLGGSAGVLAGGVVAVAGERMLRRAAPDPRRQERTALLRDLPAVCDLLAVCLAAGLPVSGALAAVAGADPGPVGAHLGQVAALYRLGAEPHRAWEQVPDELAGLGRALVRAGESGAAVVPALRALAADGRATVRHEAEAAVRRAGIALLAPLGACFLPAFVCLGVVPLVLGIAAGVFRG